jgi:hypothetical protein
MRAMRHGGVAGEHTMRHFARVQVHHVEPDVFAEA